MKNPDEFPQLKNKNINWENLQENFIFLFENTGHNIHMKRGGEMSEALICYIEMLNLM